MEKIAEKPLVTVNIGTVEYRISTGTISGDGRKFVYEVKEPAFSKETQNAYYDSFYYVQSRLTKTDLNKHFDDAYDTIEKLMKEALKPKGYQLSKAEETKIVYFLYRDMIGIGVIESLYSDREINFITCEGIGKSVYAYHSNYGFIETNIVLKNPTRLSSLLLRTLKKCTILNFQGTKGVLPDRSFIEIDTNMGFQIRKYKTSFTPHFIIKNKMATPAAMAFLDSLIKHKKNIMIVGSKASGKTMFLSGLLHTVDKKMMMCLVENEPNIAIDNMNWSSAVSRGRDTKPFIMDFFRLKPDYIVVDEISERNAKFVLNMMTGVPMILTLEAGNTDVAINKIATKFGVAKSFIANVDVIVMLGPKRDIEEILEIRNYDKEKNEINAKVVFRKERDKLVTFESKFMRSLGEEDKAAMQRKAKELHLISKKS
jgi:flagellar protein FlaI